ALDEERNRQAFTFVLKVTAENGLVGESRRTVFIIEDDELLAGFPQRLPGSGEASGLFFDLDQDGRDEYIMGDGAGYIHAFRADGSQLPGFPVAGVRSAYASVESHGMADAFAS